MYIFVSIKVHIWCVRVLYSICVDRILKETRGPVHSLKYLLKFQGPNNNNLKKIYLHKYENHPSPQYTIPLRPRTCPTKAKSFALRKRRLGFGPL